MIKELATCNNPRKAQSQYQHILQRDKLMLKLEHIGSLERPRTCPSQTMRDPIHHPPTLNLT